MSATTIIALPAFFLLRILVFNERVFPSMKGKKRTLDIAAFGSGFIVYSLFTEVAPYIWPDQTLTGLTGVAAMVAGLVILSLAYLGSRIPIEDTKDKREKIEKTWSILMGVALLSLGWGFLTKYYPSIPRPASDNRWDIAIMGSYSVALFAFSIYFRKILKIYYVVLGLLPFLLPLIIGGISLSNKNNT